ncbi:hypothetical protein COCNU_06G008220, partial [Cocos nucifera]
WVRGLYSEAIKKEIHYTERQISTEKVLHRYISFSWDFWSVSPQANPAKDHIAAMSYLLHRSLDSPRALCSTPTSPHRKEDDHKSNGDCHSS